MNPDLPQQKKKLKFFLLFLLSLMLLAGSALYSALWFLVFVSLIPLFFLIDIEPKKGLIFSFLAGLVYFFIVLYPISTLNTWWWTVSSGFLWQNKSLIYLLFCAVLALVCTLFTFGPVFFVYSKWLKKWPTATILLLPLLWTGLEMLRVWILAGLQWGTFGQPLGENLFFARAAAFGGIFSLTFVAVLLNFSLFLCLQRLLSPYLNPYPPFSWSKKQILSLLPPLLAIFLVIIALSLNETRVVARGSSLAAQGKWLNIAIIWPNSKTQDVETQAGINHIFDLLKQAVASKGGPIDMIFLPENILPTLEIDESTKKPLRYEENQEIKADFDTLTQFSSKNPQISFVLGLHSRNQSGNYNSVAVFEAGKLISLYNKQNLLPFTENSLSVLKSIHIDPLVSGTGERNIATMQGDLTPYVCSEVLVRHFSGKTEASAWGIVNLGNDNIFDSPRVASYNKIIARIRAIENSKPMIRASKGGFSGIFDATGQEIPTTTYADGEIITASVHIP